MKLYKILLAVGLFVLMNGCSGTDVKNDDKTNFVIVYCDDLGYGDIGCFGATDIKTPNIDR
jgi:arylsulfatase A